MNYFVLFSVILIAASVIVLLIPPTTEGFTSATANANMNPNAKPNANAKPKPKPSDSRPAAAGQHNLSSAAGAADGGSTNQYLMDDLLAQQDRFVEAFENRDRTNKAATVSATTTKKKGIASTGADIRGNVKIPKAGCNKDKCVLIDPKATDQQGNPIAFQGNCINRKMVLMMKSVKPVDTTSIKAYAAKKIQIKMLILLDLFLPLKTQATVTMSHMTLRMV